MSLPNILDPMIRYDDYPALFAEGDLFWEKTLNEGRWVNYLWHLRGIVTPAWLNFGAYQALWALFAAATATVVMRHSGFTFLKATLALLILVSPSALLISLWFNTLLPGLALVALFSLLACKLSSRNINLLLPIFVVLTFMAYTTYPLLLLVICLYRHDNRSLPKLIALLTFFDGQLYRCHPIHLLNQLVSPWRVRRSTGRLAGRNASAQPRRDDRKLP